MPLALPPATLAIPPSWKPEDADLGRGQAKALGVLQGGGHIVQQDSQLLVKVGDRVANLVQDGVVLL